MAVYGRRRRREQLGAVLGLFLAHAAFAAANHLLNNKGREYVSQVGWRQREQAALVLGNGRAAASPHEQPVPIASLAKVMTAYLTSMLGQGQGSDTSVLLAAAGQAAEQSVDAVASASRGSTIAVSGRRVAEDQTRAAMSARGETLPIAAGHGLDVHTITTTGEGMRRKRRSLATLALIAMVVPISACGASAPTGNGSAGAGGSNPTASAHAKAVKFAECIRSNGVSEFPDPDASGEFAYGIPSYSSPLNPSSAAFQHAIGACKALEPPRFIPTNFTPKQLAARLKFAQCMRTNGVPDFPDPTATGPLVDVSHGSSIPGLQDTIHKCIRLNPAAVQ